MKRFKKVYIEITNVCNLDCEFCPGTKRAARFMTLAEFERAADALLPYTDYVYLHLMGEPLLHPELYEILEACAARGLRVNLTTNGTLLDAPHERFGTIGEMLLRSGAVRKVAFSLHSFEANGVTEPLEAYIGRIMEFIAASREGKMLRELRLWNGRGAEAFNERIVALIMRGVGQAPPRSGGAGEEPTPPVGAGLRGAEKLGERLYLARADKFDWPDAELDELGAEVFCFGLRDQLGVLADGTVVPCCLDSDGTVALGNIFAEPLAGILGGERVKRIYDGFSARRAVEPLCRRCGYARRF